MNLRFASKEAATNAIVAMHGADVNGYSAKCSWGKEANGPVPPSFAGASTASGSDTTAASSQAVSIYYIISVSLIYWKIFTVFWCLFVDMYVTDSVCI